MKYNGAEKQKQSCVWIISQVLFIQQTGHSKMAWLNWTPVVSAQGREKAHSEGRVDKGVESGLGVWAVAAKQGGLLLSVLS